MATISARTLMSDGLRVFATSLVGAELRSRQSRRASTDVLRAGDDRQGDGDPKHARRSTPMCDLPITGK